METRFVIKENVSIHPKEKDCEWEFDTKTFEVFHNREKAESKLLKLDDDNDTYYMQIENLEELGDGYYDWVAEDDCIYAWVIKQK